MSNLEIEYPIVVHVGDGISIPSKYLFKPSVDLSPIEIDKFQYREFRKKKEIKGLYTKGRLILAVPKRPKDIKEVGGLPNDLLVFKNNKLENSSNIKTTIEDAPKEEKVLKVQTLPIRTVVKPEKSLKKASVKDSGLKLGAILQIMSDLPIDCRRLLQEIITSTENGRLSKVKITRKQLISNTNISPNRIKPSKVELASLGYIKIYPDDWSTPAGSSKPHTYSLLLEIIP